ncbi:FkbM family methyltransferase [Komagataeibacter sucrofermentans]|uniref:FkbM family methyltransferase n=1 Tax=Komagataeibacter sucrofermentans TaxID=1053551 RepID=UPI001ABEFC77|nr:FkbM family methyltransferase [Komagataeibacter sucrofermentans]
MGRAKEKPCASAPLLDILTEAKVNHVDVLKIDIEGYEDRALIPFLDTAPDSLLPKHIMMEDSERDRWQSDLMGKLAQVGYRTRARSRGNALLSRKEGQTDRVGGNPAPTRFARRPVSHRIAQPSSRSGLGEPCCKD